MTAPILGALAVVTIVVGLLVIAFLTREWGKADTMPATSPERQMR